MKSAESDRELVSASLRGDRAAFTRMVERYQRSVHAIAFSHARDRSLADDIAQEAFVTAWRRLGDLNEPARLPAWLCGIARNLARNACKRLRREELGVVPDLEDARTPLDALSDAESDRLIAAALASVPDVYREPLVLFYYEDQSIEDVARALGLTVSTANKRLWRGRRHLAERIAALVEGGLARRGPRADLVAGVLAAIGILGMTGRADASPVTVKGSTMLTRLALATAILAGVGGTAMLAGAPLNQRTPPVSPHAASTTAAPTHAQGSATHAPASSAAPGASRHGRHPPILSPSGPSHVPDCDAAARHLAELTLRQIVTYKKGFDKLPAAKLDSLTAAMAADAAKKCSNESWSDNMRICIVDAEDAARASIDCTDDPAATSDEVARLPAELACKPLAEHVYELATGAGGKYADLKQQTTPEKAAFIARFLVSKRDHMVIECEQRPWSIEHRRCLLASTSYDMASACEGSAI